MALMKGTARDLGGDCKGLSEGTVVIVITKSNGTQSEHCAVGIPLCRHLVWDQKPKPAARDLS